MLASGLVLLAHGDNRAGRRRLTKALNLAHGCLANQQLVSQVRQTCLLFLPGGWLQIIQEFQVESQCPS